MFGMLRSGNIPSLTFDGVAFTASRVLCNLGLPGLWVSAMAKKAFAQVHQLCCFLDERASDSDSCSGHLMACLLCHILCGTVLEVHPEASADLEYSSTGSDGHTLVTCNTSVLQTDLFLICFQIQFKVLVITYKARHGMEPNYLRDHRIPQYPLVNLILWVSSIKEYHV